MPLIFKNSIGILPTKEELETGSRRSSIMQVIIFDPPCIFIQQSDMYKAGKLNYFVSEVTFLY